MNSNGELTRKPGTGDLEAREETGEWRAIESNELLVDNDLPCRIGRYSVTSLLGRGGFAKVYLAKDEELDRPVALKLPRRERFSDQQKLDSVLAEARTAAKLRHPGIVTIYDVGHFSEGTPYIAMEFVPGRSLREVLAEGRIPLRRSIELVAAVAEAVHSAHRQGLVHRDLKPANILIDDRGQPRIVDFGLAVHEADQARLSGDVSGTPMYMAPEQVRGEAHRMDGRTDVWSLGIILYELMTGRRPFGIVAGQLFDEILHREPKPPRQIDDRIPKDLEDCCLRCLSKSIAGRYSTSLDLAEALNGWLQRTPPTEESAESHVTLNQGSQSTRRPIVREAYASDGVSPKVSVRWIQTAAMLLVVTGGVGVAVFGGRGTTSPPKTPEGQTPLDTSRTPVVPVAIQNAPQQTNRWNSLLADKPDAMVWSQAAQDGVWNYSAESQEVFVSSSQPTALVIGKVDSSHFGIEVRLAKSTWLGLSGIFWGVHDSQTDDGTPCIRCQTLLLHSFVEGGKVSHRISRDILNFWLLSDGVTHGMDRYQYLTVSVDPPDLLEIPLELTISSNFVRSVRWNGRLLHELCDRQDLQPPLPLISQGRLGVYNENGAAIFRDARLKVLTIPIPSEKK